MSVTYTAVLEASEDSVFLSALPGPSGYGRVPARCGAGWAPTSRCWCCAGSSATSGCGLCARDNAIATYTAYRDDGIAIRATRRPGLLGVLLAAKAAGHAHMIVDGTLIHTDRISTPGPIPGVDLWCSGKHHHHGENIQLVSAPEGGRCGPARCDPVASTTSAPPAPAMAC
ncbi:MAG TPA: hypothetical protein VLJ59_12565 [Mycobacteriales bacterium]|nr:hypothetical protein [Mycobacteriales bacterium]